MSSSQFNGYVSIAHCGVTMRLCLFALRTALLVVVTQPHFVMRGAAGSDWSVYLGDSGGTHFSSLTQVTVANVENLKPIWTYRTGQADPNNRSQIQCNPLVIDGVLYGTSPQLTLFAVNAETGEELWRFDPFASASSSAGRGLNRGLTWWQEGVEKRLMFSAGHFLYAINPATGKVIESFGQGGRVDLLTELDRDTDGLYLAANTPGAIFRDLIIMPMRVGEGPGIAAPGHIRAYNVRTGKRVWIFHTIPHPGEKGFETWSPKSWEDSGGANCWAGLVIDQERGLAFIPTGSATYDFWGGNRQGANLFANSLIALDAATGERKWHFQFVHHDLWDRDLPAPPALCDVIRNGKKIAAVSQVTKSGHVWVFDRETGESLFPWREEPVPRSDLAGEASSATQPIPLQPAPFARQRFTEVEVTDISPTASAAVLKRLRSLSPHVPFDPPSTKGTIILPGFDGGAEWGGAAVDPEGILYINSNEMAWVLNMVTTADATTSNMGASLYTQLCMACHGINREGNAAQNIPSLSAVSQKMGTAEILALLTSGKGVMPSFGFLPDEQKNALTEYILGLEQTTVAETATRKVEPAGSGTGRSPYATTGYNRFLDPDGYPALRPPWGTLNAINLNTGEYVWKKPLGEIKELTAKGIPITGVENYGGPIVTAGGLLFIAATKDEKIRAFDTKTGEKLWESSLPAGGYATPATYSVKGRQFIVIACGGGKMGTKSGDSYIAYALPE